MSPVGLIVPLSVLVGWEIATRLGWLDRTIASSPGAILGEIWTLLATGQIWVHLWATFVRVFSGFALGSLAALALGVISGIVPIVFRLLNPTIQAIRSVPSYAWVPLFILWFGIFETSKILLIGVGAFFPLYLATVTGIRSVDRKLVEVALVNDFRGLSLASRVLSSGKFAGDFDRTSARTRLSVDVCCGCRIHGSDPRARLLID